MLSTPKRSALLSWLLHCGAILLILAVTSVKPQLISRLHDVLVVPLDIASYKTSVKAGGGGGGGGVHADSPATRGELPRFAREQLVPPAVRMDESIPILPVEPTLIGDSNIKPVTFNYTVPLKVLKTNDVFNFTGDADLGSLAGGLYHYDGQAAGTNFFSTYSCKYDHGTFQMTRP